jgi:hypothetical protein
LIESCEPSRDVRISRALAARADAGVRPYTLVCETQCSAGLATCVRAWLGLIGFMVCCGHLLALVVRYFNAGRLPTLRGNRPACLGAINRTASPDVAGYGGPNRPALAGLTAISVSEPVPRPKFFTMPRRLAHRGLAGRDFIPWRQGPPRLLPGSAVFSITG